MHSSSPPQPTPALQPGVTVSDEPSTSLWDWNEFFDFSLDDQLAISFDSDQSPEIQQVSDLPPIDQIRASKPDNSDRVRKRDPRLICSNFLAGRIPCACPEIDAKLAEEEESLPGKKRARTVRAATGTARCQVPGCEADISELKGYHRRHRVCLRCANSSAVLLDGETKRYCQQCGKFHILSDFDEGKRSCRRKLERHNNRRRRKPTDSKGDVEKKRRQILLGEDVGCDDDTGKDSVCLSSQAVEGETLLESEGHISIDPAAHGSQNIQSDSNVSFAASGETQIDEEKENCTHSLTYSDNKSVFASLCPTGRISFKLYDWNPAEFPRRLRHQIFQWLASMPVELEGYIRPGCTILTMFIAMPKFMWVKLFEDPVVYIHDLLVAPGNMLSGRGTLVVNLDNMIFRVMKDGTSVMKVRVEEQAPKLHYVHPTCFEAGKAMEFVACGSNLLQPKFRFLLSFAGKYLTNDVCVPPLCNDTEESAANSFGHQLLKIYVPHTEQILFGPAFIEVENESGLSNFIPILIGDKEICSEMKIMQHKFDTSFCSKGSQFAATSSSFEVSVSRQREFSEFILNIAWLLKEPALENVQHILTSSQIRRFDCLLNFLIRNESTTILERVLYHMKIVMDNSSATGIADAEMRLCQRNMNHAKDILRQNLQQKVNLVLHVRNPVPKWDCVNQSSENDVLLFAPVTNQGMEVKERSELDAKTGLTYPGRSGTIPLLNKEVVMRMNFIHERPWKSSHRLFTNSVLSSRHLIFVITAATVCIGICVVVLHPQKVGKLATTIRRCLFDNS